MKRMTVWALWLALASISLQTCSDSGGLSHGDHDTITISGQIFLRTPGADREPASDVQVAATTDIDANGKIVDAERATAKTDARGVYSIKAPVVLGKTAVVAFEKEGYAKLLKTIAVHSLDDVTLNGNLAEMQALTCQQKRCRDDSGSVEIHNLEGASGFARVFNPVVDVDQFPGSFSDDQDNMLISGVFGAFDLLDESQQPIRDLDGGQKAKIRMKVPRDTWSVLTDIESGNGRIDVPMYYFDEASGEWVRDGSGWLENAEGEEIADASLAAIRQGNHEGALFATAEVGHFSYWNVDWPVASHACVGGVVTDESGEPVAGASLQLHGLTYTGSSSVVVTDEQGAFCVDVLRSENPGEDVDNDGVNGETQQIVITAQHGGDVYRFGPVDVTADQGSCPSGCMTVDDLALSEEHLLPVNSCTVTGTVRIDGQLEPASGVVVFADDQTLSLEQSEEACPGCPGATITGADGRYEVSTAYAARLSLFASTITSDDSLFLIYQTERAFLTCPDGPVDIDLEMAMCIARNTPVIAYNSNSRVISWTPQMPMAYLLVTSGYQPVWAIQSEDGFESPVTYGRVPSGATQTLPQGGATPPALQPGDLVVVVEKDMMSEVSPGLHCYLEILPFVVP